MSDKISFSRWSDSSGNTGIEVTIKNEKYGLLYIGDMNMADFAACVTGQSMIDIERDTRHKMQFGIENEDNNR